MIVWTIVLVDVLYLVMIVVVDVVVVVFPVVLHGHQDMDTLYIYLEQEYVRMSTI